MVNLEAGGLDRTFAALADPTRRALLARLGEEDGVSVSELARPFAMSLPAVMKHLDVLGEAGLVTRRKSGRTVTCRLNAAPMAEAMAWLRHYERFWNAALDRLAALLEETPWTTDAPPPDAAPGSAPSSPSGDGSPPPRKKSSRPGPSRS